MSGPHPYQDDLDLLTAAVRAAGAIAMGHFGGNIRSWEKGPNDPVSEADIEVNDHLEAVLRAARPAYGWLSEESADEAGRLDADRVWVIDPIDGTRAFLGGRREFSVSAALLAGNRPVIGIVYSPSTDEFYEAIEDGGARLNGSPISVSAQTQIGGARILTSRSETKKRRWDIALAECEVSAISSVALKLARVAAGLVDATISRWPKRDWDIAAGDVLVREGGGSVIEPDGAPLHYNSVGARHPGIIAGGSALVEALRRRAADL
ncbi:MAG: 3'(2'),5'-bisphosphate nucleotidase CysQ [Alphaproteobacteria bacterium]|nr:3'(2'),5'-bisphosphate nucleotidase CysQ [Alphaproteobacteria bacterium]